jgi:hypothetical protein
MARAAMKLNLEKDKMHKDVGKAPGAHAHMLQKMRRNRRQTRRIQAKSSTPSHNSR